MTRFCGRLMVGVCRLGWLCPFRRSRGRGVGREGFEAGYDGGGVELGFGAAGVGVGVGEEGLYGGFAEGVVLAGDDLVQVDEGDVLRIGDGVGPAINLGL